MPRLREALEASWDRQTAYGGIEHTGNPALGQCYPTTRVVQHYYTATEIIKGTVWTGQSDETHFWNGLRTGDDWYHIDLSWQQFLRARSSANSRCSIATISATVMSQLSASNCCFVA